ncbi:hypothetical protein M422DRAFT_260967 [Sphaerobolus stellatus SS14]|uniref:Uncharacterized protein n=1 Tax=Sphaerobolus stellatus (strain SS14) TaxID=990650 RepID=A0A0C9UPA0_SPHS4|nr:hypothetical protein M422DRAFT_260967 [Sphaerobolus stellatus SS14]
MIYAGLFNSSYQPSPIELLDLNTPVDQLGPPLLGQMFATLLEGVLLVQYYDYIVNFRYEQRWTKWLVHAGILLCSIRAFFIWWFIWDRFVLNYGNWAYVASFPAIAIGIPITGTIPNAVCQAFYIARCWTLSHNWFFLIPAMASLVVTVGAGIAQV